MTEIVTDFTKDNIESNIESKINKVLKNIAKFSFISLGPSFTYWLYKVVKNNEKQEEIFDMAFITGAIDLGKIVGELYLLDKVVPYYDQYIIPAFEVVKNYFT